MVTNNGFFGRARHLALFATVLAIMLSGPPQVHAQGRVDTDKLGEEAVRRTQEYIRINTTNPPGNESRAVAFLAGIFKDEGITFDTASSAPGRSNIWARLKGSGSEPALVLLHHMDVVPADPRYWDVDPFSATVKDGVIYGRGTLDTKTLGILQLETFLALHRAQVPLKRDVIFIASADEEAGGAYGAGWLVKNRPDAFKGAGLLLTEGGSGSLRDGRQQFFIEVTQKIPLWLKLVSTGKPGHGAIPPISSSVNALVRALYAIQTHDFEPRLVPAVDAYFKGLAVDASLEWKDAFQNMSKSVTSRDFLLHLQNEQPKLAALVRNTCSITMLQASNKVNVIPPEADAQLDCRLLQDQDPTAFVTDLASLIADPGIKIERILGFSPAVSSTDTPLYRAIVEVTRRHFPDANIVPGVSPGFTDSHFFRDLGIASYGFAPFLIPASQESGVHGNNERISIENIKRGTAMMLEMVQLVAAR
jgi:acetylornithine deacetylase/succinyl-diaminopimelate desuccinylase-like protein